ncbi:MAG: RNA polymerase sigma factor [Myxococcaceae bacterium]
MTDHAPAALSFSSLYRRHAQQVARWTQRLGGPDCDVEDVVQEVFVAVHRQLHRFRGQSQVTTWLYAITANTVRDRQRKAARRGTEPLCAVDEMASGDASADQDLEAKQLQRKVYGVLQTMKEKFRNVLILHEMEGLSGEEIGELLDAKPATVWVWLHRARKDFAKKFEEAS